MPRAQQLKNIRRLVVKVGTSQITEDGRVSEERITRLATALLELRRTHEVILVTSGAIAAGITSASLPDRRTLSIPWKQAAAAIGQTRLMMLYDRAFAAHGVVVGQVLLTKDVMQKRERYLAASNTLLALLEIGALPIVNENDTMVVDEIKVGDNDRLAAMVAQLTDAQLLVLLSDVEGFYSDFEDPEKRRLLPEVGTIDDGLMAMARPAGSRHATGGMVTKLEAARMCREAGIHTVLANGSDPRILAAILAGREVGTFFPARPRTLPARKHWILHHMPRRGTLVVDDGARQAIEDRGKSLLPRGIREVRGNFSSGDGIVLEDLRGATFALGIVNYGREELIRITGKSSTETAALLGPDRAAEAVHRDNLVLLAADDGNPDG